MELSGNPQKLTNSLSYLQGLGVNLLQLAIANSLVKAENNCPAKSLILFYNFCV
ncbi:MAG: hypothetical protein V7L14_33045 [Nostoc sp.]